MSRLTPCSSNKALNALGELYDEFTGKKSNAYKFLTDPKTEFSRFVELEMGVPMSDIAHIAEAGGITRGDVRGLRLKLSDHVRNMMSGKMPGSVNWYVPAAFAKRDPTIHKVLENMQKAGFKLNARLMHDDADMLMISELIRTESEGKALRGPARSFEFVKSLAGKTPQQKHNSLTKLKRQAIFDAANKIPGAADRLVELKSQEDALIVDTHLSTYGDLLFAVEKGLKTVVATENQSRFDKAKAEKKEYKPLINLTMAGDNLSQNLKKKDINGNVLEVDLPALLRKVTDKEGNKLSGNMQKALTSYVRMMDRAHTTLAQAVDAKIKMVETKMGDTVSKERLKRFSDDLKKKLLPDFESGFFPHFVEDLSVDFWAGMMPLFDTLNKASNRYDRKSGDELTITQAMDQINSYVSDHAKKRSQQQSYDYSPNFMLGISEYLNDVNRFNFIAKVDQYQAESLRSLEKMYKKTEAGLEGYARGVAEYIMDMHASATGRSEIDNPQMRGMLRTALGFEFVSKMGLNLRGAAKNFTQRALDYVQWSRQIIKESDEWWEGTGRADIAVGYGESADPQSVMKNLGIGFARGQAPELLESAGMGGGETKVPRLNTETGKIEFIPVSKMESVAGWVGMIGSHAAAMHRWVENRNRTKTFKIAYYQMWKWLDVPEYYEKNEGSSSKAVKNKIHKAAEKYALSMVVAHHFDYNDFSKAKILTKPFGRLLGQFQHFSFSFYEKSFDIMRKAKNDALANELMGENILRAYRYGMIYFLAPVLAAAATGIDIGNLVENDTKRRAEEMAAWMFGDEEERKKAFYGKGPVMGNIGAPIISDLLTVGQLFELWNIDDDGLLGLIAGYEDTAMKTGDRRTYEKVRLLNTALARILFRTGPQLMQARLGWALQSELGLYPTKEAREIQKAFGIDVEKMKKKSSRRSSDDILASINNLQGMPSAGRYNSKEKNALLRNMDSLIKNQLVG